MMQQFKIKFRKLIEGRYFGNFQSIFTGSGIEITDFRKFADGDDFKKINWKLTAKWQDFFVNEFQHDQELEMEVFLDINYNWRGKVGQENYKKFLEYFADIIVFCRKNFVRMKIFYNDRSEYKFWNQKNINIQRIAVAQDLSNAYSFLNQIKILVYKSPRKYFSQCSEFIEQAKKIKKRRAILIFSDFLDLTEEDQKILNYLDREHALFLFQIPVDQEEGQNYHSFFVDKKNLDNHKNKFVKMG